MKLFSKKSNIVFIGAGKIAYSFCSALVSKKYNVTTIISRSKTSARQLAKQSNISYADNLEFLSKENKIFFLTVPDNEIEKTARAISKLDLNFVESLFIHVSGTLNISVLKSLEEKKARIASFHIMQTFPSKKAVDLKGCSAAIESKDKISKEFLSKLASDLNLKSFYIEPDKKVFYHLAGVFASNFLAGNLSSSEKLFKMIEVDKMDFFSVYESTINSTLQNIKNFGAAKALSGPVERGDYQTIEKHLTALEKKDKLIFKNYIIQSLNLLEVSKIKNGKLNEGQKKIKKNLSLLFIAMQSSGKKTSYI